MLRAGDLLLASPGMHDSIFDRTIIHVFDHGPHGSMGLVLNRPTPITVSAALPQFAELAQPDLLYVGGPVEEGTALVLVEPVDPATDTLHHLHNGVGLLDLSEEAPLDGIQRLRVYTGYTGWGPGQLDAEMERGAWITAPCEPDDIWTRDRGEQAWATVLRRQGGLTSFLRDYPDQPWLN